MQVCNIWGNKISKLLILLLKILRVLIIQQYHFFPINLPFKNISTFLSDKFLNNLEITSNGML